MAEELNQTAKVGLCLSLWYTAITELEAFRSGHRRQLCHRSARQHTPEAMRGSTTVAILLRMDLNLREIIICNQHG